MTDEVFQELELGIGEVEILASDGGGVTVLVNGERSRDKLVGHLDGEQAAQSGLCLEWGGRVTEEIVHPPVGTDDRQGGRASQQEDRDSSLMT